MSALVFLITRLVLAGVSVTVWVQVLVVLVTCLIEWHLCVSSV